MMLRTVFATIAAFVMIAVTPPPAPAAEPLKMRISLDTGPAHARNKALENFVAVLNERAKGRLEVKIFDSGQLYRDRDVAKALRQGAVEMAVPGFWFLGGLVAEAEVTMLPVFYGIDRETAYKLLDGVVADEVNPKLGDQTRSQVLGKWLTMGFANTYSMKVPLNKQDDVAGLKIRAPGGSLLVARISALGATPVNIPWTDLPLALSQGTVDAFVSSHESLVSAKMWDAGVKYGFEDHHFYAAYVPMVSDAFWSTLSPDLQQAIKSAWADTIDGARESTATAQAEARDTLIANGMTIVTPAPAESEKWRRILMKDEDDLVAKMKMNPDFVKRVAAEYDRLKK